MSFHWGVAPYLPGYIPPDYPKTVVCQLKHVLPEFWTMQKGNAFKIANEDGSEYDVPCGNIVGGAGYRTSHPDIWVQIPKEFYAGHEEANEWGEVAP